MKFFSSLHVLSTYNNFHNLKQSVLIWMPFAIQFLYNLDTVGKYHRLHVLQFILRTFSLSLSFKWSHLRSYLPNIVRFSPLHLHSLIPPIFYYSLDSFQFQLDCFVCVSIYFKLAKLEHFSQFYGKKRKHT